MIVRNLNIFSNNFPELFKNSFSVKFRGPSGFYATVPLKDSYWNQHQNGTALCINNNCYPIMWFIFNLQRKKLPWWQYIWWLKELHCLKVHLLGLVTSVTWTRISVSSSPMQRLICCMWGKQSIMTAKCDKARPTKPPPPIDAAIYPPPPLTPTCICIRL